MEKSAYDCYEDGHENNRGFPMMVTVMINKTYGIDYWIICGQSSIIGKKCLWLLRGLLVIVTSIARECYEDCSWLLRGFNEWIVDFAKKTFKHAKMTIWIIAGQRVKI